MAQKHVRVVIGVNRLTDNQLQELTGAIVSSMTGNKDSGQLVVKVNAIHTAESYEAQYASMGTGGTPGTLQKLGGFTNSRSMTITGLTPGMTYMVQVRAVGGTTRYGDWSDPVRHMCM